MRTFLFSFLLIVCVPVYAHNADCERNLLAEIKTAGFSESLDGVTDIRGSVVRQMLDMPADRKITLSQQLTERHLNREMSFQVKNEVTGFYDKFVAVEANFFAAPFLKSDYDRMVQSTGPLMRLYRALLQKIYSIPNPGLKDLGLESLPAIEAELALQTIRESIYFEPALVHPNMAKYPFLTVAGFDGVIGNPARPSTEFFETNLGTPSGISNNVQLLEDLLWLDEPLRKLVSPHLPKDETFALLRRAVESNARAWTGRDGLSVVISPGIYNGAHPDVASIARATGMPLIKSSDLYEDANGDIRLNTGRRGNDPVVTGIYGRMEESFFLQSNEDGIPMIAPHLDDGGALSRKLGVPLRPGAVYDFIEDSGGEITGVRRDAEGRPLLRRVWNSISADPMRPEVKPGSLAKAIVARKLYYSAVGGRVVDDKRLFHILTAYLLPQSEDLARPIRSLSIAEYPKFYADPSQFVVKDPNNSGGVGIYFPRAMAPEEVTKLSRRVRENPKAYKIEYIGTLATLPRYARAQSGLETLGQVPIDLRIFIMMDAEGNVDAGPNSILLRTGAKGSLFTNTSRGGGYGIGMVLNEKPGLAQARRPEWIRSRQDNVPESRYHDIGVVLGGARELLKCVGALRLSADEAAWNDCRGKAYNLSYAYREIMDLINPWQLSVVPALRDFAFGVGFNGDQAGELAATLITSLRQMKSAENEQVKEMAASFFKEPGTERLFGAMDPVDLQHLKLPARAKLRRLREPEVSYEFEADGRFRSRKLEYAEYISVDNPEVQAVIDEVKAFGGQVRLLLREDQVENPLGTERSYRRDPAYFWINMNPKAKSYLVPVIGVDLSRELALASLHHELEHFRMFRELYANYRARGFNHEKAVIRAYADSETEENIVTVERRAVRSEIRSEIEFGSHPFNRFFGVQPKAKHYYDLDYVNRMVYPEFEGIRMHLRKAKDEERAVNAEFLRKSFKSVIEMALSTREQAVEYWKARDPRGEEVRAWRESNVFLMMTQPSGFKRLQNDKITEEFSHWLKETCLELGVSQVDCGY